MFLGLKNKVLDQNVVDILALATLLTIAVSSYTLVFSTKIYRKVEKFLRPFESKKTLIETNQEQDLENHVVLVGAGRLGWEILKQLEKQGEKILAVDFNPTMINILKENGVNYLFGDITDPEIFQEAKLEKAKMVISTVFDPEDTEELLNEISLLPHKPVVFVTASEREMALKFYHLGASYVVIPRILSGHQVAHLVTKHKFEEIKEGELKKDHLEELREELAKIGL